jgi:hypothetical protein
MDVHPLSIEGLKKVGDTDASRITVAGHRVFDPLVFPQQHPTTGAEIAYVNWNRRQYLFAQSYRKTHDVDVSAKEAGISVEAAKRFLDREDVKAWMTSKRMKDAVREKWEAPEEWYAEGQKLYNEPEVPKHRLEIWKEFGARAAVKPSRNEPGSNQPKIEIHIDSGAVQRCLEKQKAIDAEISQ